MVKFDNLQNPQIHSKIHTRSTLFYTLYQTMEFYDQSFNILYNITVT